MFIRTIFPGEETRVWNLCQRSFAGFPWFETMPDEAIQNRWRQHNARTNFCCLVAEINTQIAGVSWFHEITDDELELEKDKALREFATTNFPAVTRIWVDATVTDPDFQKSGVATQLKVKLLEMIRTSYPETCILTRMRDDNVGIIRINERFGFKRTGVKVLGKNDIRHEFWYLHHKQDLRS
jgi:RimJ/RimL family protein N-acetyltransferase